jgi:hypothetical protein
LIKFGHLGKKKQYNFIFQPKVLEFSKLSFNTHSGAFPAILKFGILKNFGKNLEKIFKNFFFEFFAKKYEE